MCGPMDWVIQLKDLVMRDMSDPLIQQEYDTKIYDGARDLAVQFRGDPQGMAAYLSGLGASGVEIIRVIDAMNDPEYFEDNYRGAMVDEGVVEALKDILRPIHGF